MFLDPPPPPPLPPPTNFVRDRRLKETKNLNLTQKLPKKHELKVLIPAFCPC